MPKHTLIAAATVCTLLAPPVFAQGIPDLTPENIGKGVGAVAGALIGSQIGGGSGKLAAVAVGTLAGYWIGGNVGQRLSQTDRAGIATTTSRAVYSGQDTSWRNPDTGMKTTVSVRDVPAGNSNQKLKAALETLPTIEMRNSFYKTSSNVNVRGGPGTDFEIVHRIEKGESVPVIGKVLDRNWYLVAEQGKAAGFIYVPLLNQASTSANHGNAIRQSSQGLQPGRYVAAEQQCRIITQQVKTVDGAEDSHQFKACQQADGNWVKV